MFRTPGSSTYEPTTLSNYQPAPGEYTIGISDEHYNTKSVLVEVSGTIGELKAGKAQWKPNIESQFFSGLQRLDADGVLRGDLSKTLLKKVTLKNIRSTLPFSVSASMFDGETLKTTDTMDRNGNECGTIIHPGYTKQLAFHERVAIEPPVEFLKANSLTEKDLQSYQVGEHETVEATSVLGQHCLAPSLREQWSQANPNYPPVQASPAHNVVVVHPAYLKYVQGNLAKLREKSIEMMPQFYTNIPDISVRLAPTQCSWNDIDTHPDLVKATSFERTHETTRNHTISFQMELTYAIFDPDLLTKVE